MGDAMYVFGGMSGSDTFGDLFVLDLRALPAAATWLLTLISVL
jgi:hypothetical protein